MQRLASCSTCVRKAYSGTYHFSMQLALFHLKSMKMGQTVLSEIEQLTLMQSVIHNPTMFLHEMQQLLHNVTGTWVLISTIIM